MPNFSIYNGIHGEIPSTTTTEIGFISAFMTLSIWLVIEFHVQVFHLFKRRSGLYFWSLLALSWGVLMHSIGYLLNWFSPRAPWQLYALMNAIGWSMMVTGESLVLYSRLHLVTRNVKVHRFVLGIIIFTAIFVQIPNWVISIPAVDRDLSVSASWSPRDSIETRIQQLAFLLQEGIISCLYIWYTGNLLRPNLQIRERRVMLDLIYVSVTVIFLDIVVIILVFTNQHLIKEPLQNVSYALKLKLEFFVLNQLMEMSRDGFSSGSGRKSRYVAPSADLGSRAYGDYSGALDKTGQDNHYSSALSPGYSDYRPHPGLLAPANAYFGSGSSHDPRYSYQLPGVLPMPASSHEPSSSQLPNVDLYNQDERIISEQMIPRDRARENYSLPDDSDVTTRSWLHLSEFDLVQSGSQYKSD